MAASKRLLPSLTVSLLAASCDLADSGNQIAAPAKEAAPPMIPEVQRPTVSETLSGSADHALFVQALQSGGLIEIFQGARAYTVFAPTNAAFAAAFGERRSGLDTQEQRERLIERLSHHVVPGTFTAAEISSAISRAPNGRVELGTVTGEVLTFSREGGAIVISDGGEPQARITNSAESLSNGAVHGIDHVLDGNG